MVAIFGLNITDAQIYNDNAEATVTDTKSVPSISWISQRSQRIR